MENNQLTTKQQLQVLLDNATFIGTVIENILVSERFIELYQVVNGIRHRRTAEAFYETEKYHFLKLVQGNDNLQQCTKLSLYGVFMDVAVSGLSFDPTMKHVYIVPYNVNSGTKNEPVWEKRASLQISGYGELLLRTLQGQVKYTDSPVVVYEGDHFKYGNMNGQSILEHVATIPRTSNNIIAAYIRIVRHDDTADYKVMAREDIDRLKKFSKDPNSKAWTDGFHGMVEAKIIKHAFKNYPKVRVGEFTKLSSDIVDAEPTPEMGFDYGLGQDPVKDMQRLPEATGSYVPAYVVTPAEKLPASHKADPVNDFINSESTKPDYVAAPTPTNSALDF
ncbi:recombinase RecT [Chitinophaga sp. Hz27]|uniref:recombinase RecT n=1 Tax=Chitinophaga sp. Hz27 TaxID=3347169 RepID=UPI0035DCEF7F